MPPSKPENAPAPVLDAVKLGRAEELPGQASYRVLDTPPAEKKTENKRAEARRRTRLRSGKILSRNGKFLLDCQIHDRSEHGARLILAAKIKLPPHIHLFSDIDGEMIAAELAWQRGQTVGIAFAADARPLPLSAAQIAALRKKIYAV